MIYFKSVLHKAFINVNRNQSTEQTSPTRQIHHRLPQPTPLVVSQQLRLPLRLQPQIRTHHLRRRLHHT